MQVHPTPRSLPNRPASGSGRKAATHPKTVSWRSRAKAAINRKEAVPNGNGSHAARAVLPPAAQSATVEPARASVSRASSPVAVKPAVAGATVVVAHADEELLASLTADLRREGYNVLPVETAADAAARIRAVQPALVLLDLALPDQPGLEVCKQLKGDPLTADTQVIFLSAENNDFDRVVGFELGADDFISTPCNLRELVLRVRAVLRRTIGGQERRVVAVGPIVVDHRQCQVSVHGNPVHVTAIEFKIVALLAGRAGVVQSRDTLLAEVWGDEMAIDARSVDTYLRRLRLKRGSAANHLRTVRGLGYRLVA